MKNTGEAKLVKHLNKIRIDRASAANKTKKVQKREKTRSEKEIN